MTSWRGGTPATDEDDEEDEGEGGEDEEADDIWQDRGDVEQT